MKPTKKKKARPRIAVVNGRIVSASSLRPAKKCKSFLNALAVSPAVRVATVPPSYVFVSLFLDTYSNYRLRENPIEPLKGVDYFVELEKLLEGCETMEDARKIMEPMLTDQNFNVKDHIILGSTFFAHPKFLVDYSLAQNFKSSEILHEHANFVFMREPGHDAEKAQEKLEAFGCRFSDSFDYGPIKYVPSEFLGKNVLDGLTPSFFVGFKAIYSPAMKKDYRKHRLDVEPLAPKWLNHISDEQGNQTILQALIDHYTFPGSSEYRLF